MPIVSEFYGIKMNDHLPPHFHAEYGDSKVLVDIKTGTIIKGVFPFKQLKLVLAWCEIHREELLRNWENAFKHEELYRINPLVRGVIRCCFIRLFRYTQLKIIKFICILRMGN